MTASRQAVTEPTPLLGQGTLGPDALRAANINPDTGLATDYLNHFNEVMMLMEMLPDMPDCAEDVLDWAPADYIEHFTNSGFKDKELAVLAYHAAPHEVRAHLVTLVLQIEAEVERAQAMLREDAGDTACRAVARLATDCIKPLILAASSAIHGQAESEDDDQDESVQAGVDALFG
ncbi:hypothetical protein [uncultured Maricaulis sp.]|uniref:hypothetical protein n=1 Tax=uncultured Maricaulis sp. TaxID=174710 RepID=UPI0030DB336E|tara:strand:+ start:20864 stop:21391 length:528 start_codon:yes stop_codon:yes gene_type:complete